MIISYLAWYRIFHEFIFFDSEILSMELMHTIKKICLFQLINYLSLFQRYLHVQMKYNFCYLFIVTSMRFLIINIRLIHLFLYFSIIDYFHFMVIFFLEIFISWFPKFLHLYFYFFYTSSFIVLFYLIIFCHHKIIFFFSNFKQFITFISTFFK